MSSGSNIVTFSRRWLLAASCAMAASWGGAAAVAASDADKIVVLINPNSNETATQSMAALAQATLGPLAHVEGRSNAAAPSLLTTPEDMVLAKDGVVAIGREAASDPRVGALIVSAFSDPGLEELRAAVNIPVFGIGEEVFHEAARDGRAFGIVTVTPDPALIESFRMKAAALGYEAQYRGTRVTPGDPKVLVADPAKLDAALAEAVQQSLNQDGAEAVIMGGGPLSDAAIRLQPTVKQPLVVAVNAAAKAAAKALTAK